MEILYDPRNYYLCGNSPTGDILASNTNQLLEVKKMSNIMKPLRESLIILKMKYLTAFRRIKTNLAAKNVLQVKMLLKDNIATLEQEIEALKMEGEQK